MKDKAIVLFRRLPRGEVIGEIANAMGQVVMSRNFGAFTDAEIENVLEAYKASNTEVNVFPALSVTGN